MVFQMVSPDMSIIQTPEEHFKDSGKDPDDASGHVEAASNTRDNGKRANAHTLDLTLAQTNAKWAPKDEIEQHFFDTVEGEDDGGEMFDDPDDSTNDDANSDNNAFLQVDTTHAPEPDDDDEEHDGVVASHVKYVSGGAFLQAAEEMSMPSPSEDEDDDDDDAFMQLAQEIA